MAVGGEAVVVARVGHRDALNDQAPVAHDHAAVLVVAQRNSLGLIVIRYAVLILRFNCPHAHFAALVERPTDFRRTSMFMHNGHVQRAMTPKNTRSVNQVCFLYYGLNSSIHHRHNTNLHHW